MDISNTELQTVCDYARYVTSDLIQNDSLNLDGLDLLESIVLPRWSFRENGRLFRPSLALIILYDKYQTLTADIQQSNIVDLSHPLPDTIVQTAEKVMRELSKRESDLLHENFCQGEDIISQIVESRQWSSPYWLRGKPKPTVSPPSAHHLDLLDKIDEIRRPSTPTPQLQLYSKLKLYFTDFSKYIRSRNHFNHQALAILNRIPLTGVGTEIGIEMETETQPVPSSFMSS